MNHLADELSINRCDYRFLRQGWSVSLPLAPNEHFMKYRQQANEVMFNLLDSHDTPRILTI